MNFEVFTDGELEVIQALKDALPLFDASYADIAVGVKKQVWSTVAITVRNDGGGSRDKVMKRDTFGVNIFVDGKGDAGNYEFAQALAAHVESVILNLPFLPNSIKNVTLISGSLRVLAPENEGEQRYIIFQALRRANTIETTN